MKIKRFIDTDMRQVLRRVREDQGPDAVILSNRRVDQGIEVIAAIDYDEALIQTALGSPSPSAQAAPAAVEQPASNEGSADETVQDSDIKEKGIEETVEVVAADLRETDTDAPTKEDVRPSTTSRDFAHRDAAIDALHADIANMRGMLETQLSNLAWGQTVKQSPMRAQILRNLTKLGIAPDIANIIVNRTEPVKDARESWRAPLKTLAKTIPLIDDGLLRDGGVAALVGPTGVGKTTTIAKIASRYAMRHGTEQIALISADAHRIGAQEHLATFAKILGVKVYPAEDLTVLEQLLDQLSDKRLVLIDTEGTSQRNINLTARLVAYGNNEDRVRFYLTLAATCQEAGLDEILRIFNRLPLSGAVITKIDEAAQLGCVLGALIRHDLPAAFLSDGQRIPDDLHLAAKKRLWLINQSVECMRSSEIKVDEEMMIEKFGTASVAHA